MDYEMHEGGWEFEEVLFASFQLDHNDVIVVAICEPSHPSFVYCKLYSCQEFGGAMVVVWLLRFFGCKFDNPPFASQDQSVFDAVLVFVLEIKL